MTRLAKKLSSGTCQCRNDLKLGHGAGRRNGSSAQTCEVVTVGTSDAFDQTEGAQAMQLTRQCRIIQRDEWFDVGAAHAVNVELRALQGTQQTLLGALEEVQSLDRAVPVTLRFAQPSQITRTRCGVIQSRKELQIAAIAAGQNFTQVDQAIDTLLQGSDLAGAMSILVFHLAVVLEKGNIVGGGFQAQHAPELVVHLDASLAEAMLDAGALDTGGKTTSNLLGEQWSNLLAQKTGDLLGFDSQHRLARELLV